MAHKELFGRRDRDARARRARQPTCRRPRRHPPHGPRARGARTPLIRHTRGLRPCSACVRVTGGVTRLAGLSFWIDAAILGAHGIATALFGPGGAGLHSSEDTSAWITSIECRDVLVSLVDAWCGAAAGHVSPARPTEAGQRRRVYRAGPGFGGSPPCYDTDSERTTERCRMRWRAASPLNRGRGRRSPVSHPDSGTRRTSSAGTCVPVRTAASGRGHAARRRPSASDRALVPTGRAPRPVRGSRDGGRRDVLIVAGHGARASPPTAPNPIRGSRNRRGFHA